MRATPADQRSYVVRGRVNSDGSTMNAGEFTSSKGSAGYYRVRFLTRFRFAPVVTATADNGGAIFANAANIGETNAWDFRTFNNAGTLTDSAFAFTASGPVAP